MRFPIHPLTPMHWSWADAGRSSPLSLYKPIQRYLLVVIVLTLASGAALGSCTLWGGTSARSASVKPTPTSPEQRQLATAVALDVWALGVQKVATTYDPQQASATVTITLGGAVPVTAVQVSAAQDLTKSFCLMALQALWTSGVPLSQTMVLVEGPAQDEYADLVNQPYGAVKIAASAARHIDWAEVTADTAWSQYADEFLRVSFVVVD